MSVEQARPVFGLKSLLQVAVDENFDGLALSSDRERGDFFWRSEVTKDEGTKDWREGAPISDDITWRKNK